MLGPMLEARPSGSAAPYSAVRESSRVQTLYDGTHISSKATSEKIYRDSQGRTRTERPFCGIAAGDPDGLIIEISDPVAGYADILDPQSHIAHRYVLQTKQPVLPVPSGVTGITTSTVLKNLPPRPDGVTRTTESLGSQTMEGVYVEGTKTTETFPIGAVDNDRPISVSRENWFSPDLRVMILSKNSDPRSGDLTTRLTNVDRSEPSLSLFQPPPDFKIVDETDRVKLTYKRN